LFKPGVSAINPEEHTVTQPHTDLALRAGSTFRRHIGQNPYPGRCIVAGYDETGENLIQVYGIMGRSAPSRNRVFESDGHLKLRTCAADPKKVEGDPGLLIYTAMRPHILFEAVHIVSNGDQTDTVAESGDFTAALRTRKFEPDKPNFTPRITAQCCHGRPISMSLIKKATVGEEECIRNFFEFDAVQPGYGYCLTTYMGNGQPLPSFEGEPLLMPLLGSIEEVAQTYWAAFDQSNRVSLAVKFIPKTGDPKIHVINQYEKVP
jgi:IMP cyclohydrolase